MGRVTRPGQPLAKSDPNDTRSRHLVAMAGREIGDIRWPSDRRKALAVYDHSLARLRETTIDERAQRDEAELRARIAAWKPDPQNDLRDANSLSLAWAGLSGPLRRHPFVPRQIAAR